MIQDRKLRPFRNRIVKKPNKSFNFLLLGGKIFLFVSIRRNAKKEFRENILQIFLLIFLNTLQGIFFKIKKLFQSKLIKRKTPNSCKFLFREFKAFGQPNR